MLCPNFQFSSFNFKVFLHINIPLLNLGFNYFLKCEILAQSTNLHRFLPPMFHAVLCHSLATCQHFFVIVSLCSLNL